MSEVPFEVRQIGFPSGDGLCVGDLYLPAASEARPCILMAHGFAAERRWKLPAYAEAFAKAGFAVLLFDYRNFGDSPGTPRQWISPARHLEDFRSALRYARSRRELNPARLITWGCSFSAGHTMYLAAEEPQIYASLFLVPFFDFWPVMKLIPAPAIMALTPFALADAMLGLAGMSLDLQIVGDPGEIAMLTFPGWKKGILEGVPLESRWQNKAPARIALELPFFRPGLLADKLRHPTQIIYGTRDTGIPAAAVEETAARMPQCELQPLKMGHIDPFKDSWFPRVAALQLAFLQKQISGDG